mmetsp:Transcript_4602/g.11152  ORF Transcript_4602/g.11152 Transcript_4602/m.11152 type:complete len:223 (+) Transcript_4602:1255-1923(+)
MEAHRRLRAARDAEIHFGVSLGSGPPTRAADRGLDPEQRTEPADNAEQDIVHSRRRGADLHLHQLAAALSVCAPCVLCGPQLCVDSGDVPGPAPQRRAERGPWVCVCQLQWDRRRLQDAQDDTGRDPRWAHSGRQHPQCPGIPAGRHPYVPVYRGVHVLLHRAGERHFSGPAGHAHAAGQSLWAPLRQVPAQGTDHRAHEHVPCPSADVRDGPRLLCRHLRV